MRNFSESLIDRLVGLTILLFSIVIIAFMITGGCGSSGGGGDGDGNGEEEFTVFDVTIRVLGVEPIPGLPTNCPESASLKLSLYINENDISGFAELFKFGNIGHPRDVSGLIEDSSFSLEPFSINVYSDPPSEGIPFVGELALKFDVFEGTIIADEQEMSRLNIEGIVSGDIGFGETDAISCSAEFTGEFSGEARSPEGCVSKRELPTFECLTEGLIILCSDSPEYYGGYFCFGDCDEITGLCWDYLLYPAGCEVVDCVSLSSCEGIPPVTNLGVDDFGNLSGNFGTPDNVGDPLACYFD